MAKPYIYLKEAGGKREKRKKPLYEMAPGREEEGGLIYGKRHKKWLGRREGGRVRS